MAIPLNSSLSREEIITLLTEYIVNYTSTITYPNDIVANSLTATGTFPTTSIVGQDVLVNGDQEIRGNLYVNSGPMGSQSSFYGSITVSDDAFIFGNTQTAGVISASTGSVSGQWSAGSIVTSGTVTTSGVVIVSSEKIKVDIMPLNLTESVEKIEQLELFSYKYNSTFAPFLGKMNNVTVRGLIAEQAEKVDPLYTTRTVVQIGWETVHGPKNTTRQVAVTIPVLGVDYGRIIPDMMAAIKVLRQQVKTLEQKLASLGG